MTGALHIQHVSIAVPDDRLDECIRFYTEVLGMRQIDNPASR